MKPCHRHACGLVLAVLLGATSVRAIQWIGSDGDVFNAATSWNGGIPPSGSNSVAEFDGYVGAVVIQLSHTVGTLRYGEGFSGGGFIVRNGGSLALINGVVNNSVVSPEFSVRNGILFFTGNAPKLGDAAITVESAGLLKLFTANHPDGAAARVNLVGGAIGMNNVTDGGSVSIGELKGTAGTVGLPGVALTVGALGTNATFAGTINSAGAVTKVGDGTWTLTGANTYTGPTLISAGTIKINNASGSAFGTGKVTIGSDGRLTGAGAFTGALENNGVYAPGNSPALVTLSSFSQGATGILEMEIAGLARGAGYDALNITGALTFDGTLRVLFIDGFTPEAGQSFDLFDFDNVSGAFDALDLPTLLGGLQWDASDLYTTGTLGIIAGTVPEPGACAALFGGVALFIALLRRVRGGSR
jgi:autotransporter-associated beta strand protein